jgi:hypothetical protein
MPRTPSTTTNTEVNKKKKKEKTIDENDVKIAKKIASYEEDVASANDELRKLELVVQSHKEKRRKWVDKKLKFIKDKAKNERIRFLNNFSINNGPVVTPWIQGGGYFPTAAAVDQEDYLTSLPSDMLAAIANYMGPLELVEFYSISHAIEKKMVPRFSELFNRLTLSMKSFVKPESILYFTQSNRWMESLAVTVSSTYLGANSRHYDAAQCSVIRSLLHKQYIAYRSARYCVNFDNTLEHTYGLEANSSYIRDTQSPFLFTPLTAGHFLTWTANHKLSTVLKKRKMENAAMYMDVGNGSDDMLEYMKYDDCNFLGLKNLAHGEYRSKTVPVAKVLYLAPDYTLKHVNVKTLRRVYVNKAHHDKQLFVDMVELENFSNIENVVLRYESSKAYLEKNPSIDELKRRLEKAQCKVIVNK